MKKADCDRTPLRAMKLEEWPAHDRAAWEAARTPGDILEPGSGGLAARWKLSTVRTIAKAYGQYLQFLAQRGVLADFSDPSTRLNPKALAGYIGERRKLNASGTVLGQVRFLNCAAKAMYPTHDWTWMDGAIRALSFLVKPARDKRGHVVPVQDLLDYGLELMAKAEAVDGGTLFTRALSYRDGLMVAMLASRPFREANFASIIIGKHLIFRGSTYWLQFTADEMKNGRSVDLPLPEFLNSYINRYRDHFRTALFPKNRGWTQGIQETGPGCSALWISSRGLPMPPGTVYERITTLTQAKFGRAINPHLFRDCAATSIAMDDPQHVRIAAKLLGHSRSTTTERYYVQAQSFEASRRYQGAVRVWREGDSQHEVAAETALPSEGHGTEPTLT